MDVKLIFVLTAFFIYAVYNIVSLCLFGVPDSLSLTFYLYQEKRKWMKVLFPLMMLTMAGCLLPVWLEISEGSDLQFMSFLAAAGIMFTGSAPSFLSCDLENKVHSFSAITAAIFALLWVIFVAKLWYIIVIWFAIILVCSLLTKTIKRAYVYWLETVAFMSTFVSILIYYLR